MDGLLIIDKPKGLTSHDIVLKVRRKINQQKIGHTGTLDPIATGILVLALGKATKSVPRLTNQDKEYEVTLRLGIKTDSGDITGRIITEIDTAGLNIDEIREVIYNFKGLQKQTPPMVSAKKFKGQPLYKYARQGKIIERESKVINIYDITINEIKVPEVFFMVRCSKGTYIRTLCEDIGDRLNTGGCASAIRRTKNGTFSLDRALPLTKLLEMDIGLIKQKIIPASAIENLLSNQTINTCADK